VSFPFSRSWAWCAALRCDALLVAGHGLTQLADLNADVLRSALLSVSRGATRLLAAGAKGPDGLGDPTLSHPHVIPRSSHPINLTRAVRRTNGFECVRWITKLLIANSTCPLRLAVRSPPPLQHTSRPPHIPRKVNNSMRIHTPGSSKPVLPHRRSPMPSSSTRPMASPVGIRPWVALRPTP
jgi:hypothetical protein